VRLLVVHQNFPGQFRHLLPAWQRRPGWQVRGLGRDRAPGLPGFEGLKRYRAAEPARAVHPYLRRMEQATLHGQAAARAMLELARTGFTPDVIVAHPGWGESLYAKDVYPDARIVHFCEWYYAAHGADLGFDPEFPVRLDDHARVRTWNALHALNLLQCDAGVSPTRWQRSRHPEALQPKIAVQHEGIALERLGPDPTACLATPSGAVLRSGDPVVTYVARHLEPYRGFHVFMRALERLQAANRKAHAVIIGGDGVSYGARPADAPNWRERLLREVRLDPTRTHFLGHVPYETYLRALQVSAAHVYLSYPFVLSWSLLEAMACGALVVGSDRAPVRDVVRDGANGRLVPFFEVSKLVDVLLAALDEPAAFAPHRERARRDMACYSVRAGLAGYDALLAGGSPSARRLERNLPDRVEGSDRAARPVVAAA
jgi:glycosyltransferase involved in cell wall biosynthesis